LTELIVTLHRRGERYLRLKLGFADHKAVSDREHAALLRVVRRGDVITAQKLITEHLLDTGALLHTLLNESERATGPERASSANLRKARASASKPRRA
jgi:DNA-binding GntR family transcriptional regulator